MKTHQQLEEELVREFVARQSVITYTGIGSSIRGYITAVALKLRELWNEVTQIKRKLFINTAESADLDILAEERGVTRLGATKAGAMLLFTGTLNTVITANTVITDPTSNIGYKLQENVTIGGKNPNFVIDGAINIANASIGDIAWAECLIAGTNGNCQANSITQLSLSGVTSVTNPSPAQGGKDIESDDELRYRLKNYIKLLNQQTQQYYQALCKDLDSRVLRVLAQKDTSRPDGIKIIITTTSGVPLPQVDLDILSAQIKEKQRSFTEISCANIAFTLVSVSMRVKLKPIVGSTIDSEKYFRDASAALAKYFDWSMWEYDKDISVDDVYIICQAVPQTDDIELSTFQINGSNGSTILIGSTSLPYFQSISITDITKAPYLTQSNTSITQNYLLKTIQQNQNQGVE